MTDDQPTRPSAPRPGVATTDPQATNAADTPSALPSVDTLPTDRVGPRPDPNATQADGVGGRPTTPDATQPAHGRRPAAGDTQAVASAGPPGVLRVPGYEVRGEIARGGMGCVLAAADLAFGREVALKVVLPGPDPTAPRRFVREARITGRLAHPSIPPAYHLGRLPDGAPFLAMKLVRGRTLADLLRARPDPGHDLPRFVGVFEQVCQAVGFAHSQGVVHRDLKPANVMVGAFGEVQVMDWGLAVVRGEAGVAAAVPVADGSATTSPLVTRAGAVMGTPAYMAPEQARGEPVEAPADVFALGGILAAVLTGRPPFAGPDADSTVALAAAGDTKAVLAALDECPADAELVDLARSCLAPARADRPTDGTAVAALVAEYRAGVEDRLRKAERERAAAEARAAELRKRRRVQLALAAAVVLLVAGAGAVAVWRVDEAGKKEADGLRARAEQARQEQIDRDRADRATAAVAGLLDQARAVVAAGDADRAAPFLDQAARRAADDGVAAHAPRLAALRADAAVLRALDGVDDFRWTPVESRFPEPGAVVARWTEALAGFGVVPGNPPAVARVRGSAARAALVAALDGWLARSPADAAERVRALAEAADADPFRDEVRRLLAAGDGQSLAALAARPEWEKQPSGLVQAYAASPAVPVAAGRALMARVAVGRPEDFGLAMQLGGTYPVSVPDGAAERVRWFQAAVALRPRSAAARNGLGTALRDARDPAAAAAVFREAIRIDPTYARPHNGLGVALADARDVAGAAAAFREAARLDPTDPRPRNNLGNALRALGDPAGAAAAFREAIPLAPGDHRPHHNLGNALRDLRNWKGAASAYREASRLAPGVALPRHFLGVALEAANDLPGAVAAYREAAVLDPHSVETHVSLGGVLLRSGQPTEATAAYRAALALEPDSSEARAGLAASARVVPTAPPPRPVGW